MPERIGFMPRLIAAIIDGVIVIVAMLILSLLGNSWIGNVLRSLVVLGYYFTEVLNAATPGKKIMGLMIGSEAGTRADQQVLLKRYLIKSSGSLIMFVAAVLPFLGFLSFISGLIGIVLFFGCFLVFKVERQALHDILAKTAVYRAEHIAVGAISSSVGTPPVAPPPPPPSPQVDEF